MRTAIIDTAAVPAASGYDTGVASGAILLAFGLTLLIALIPYVWIALALSGVFRKAGQPAWKAWVPVLNTWTLYELGGQPGWWAILALVVPVVPWVFLIIAVHEVNRRFGQGGGLTVLAVFLFPVWASILAWGPAQWRGAAAAPQGSWTAAPAGAPAYGTPAPYDAAAAPAFGSVPPLPPAPAAFAPPAFAPPAVPPPASAEAPAAPPTYGSAPPPVPPAPAAGEPAPAWASVPPPPAPPAPPAPAAAPVSFEPPPAWGSVPPPPPLPPVPPLPAAFEPAPAAPESAPATPEPAPAPFEPAPAAGSVPPPPAPPTVPVSFVPPAAPAPDPWAPPAVAAPAPAAPAAPVAPGSFTGIVADAAPAASEGLDLDDDHTVVVRRTRQPAWRLVLPDAREIALESDTVLLGRNPAGAPAGAQSIPVIDATRTVSKTHAVLRRTGDGWSIEDLGSTNGVCLIGGSGEEIELTGIQPVTARFLLGDAELTLLGE